MRKTVFSALVAVAVLSPAAVVTAQSVDASVMAQRIGSRLKESGQLRDYRVGIKYVDGVACLTGTVTSPEQAETALRLAQQVEGVTHVVNDLSIDGSPIQAANYQPRPRAQEPQQLQLPPATPQQQQSSRRPAGSNWNQQAVNPGNSYAAGQNQNMSPQQAQQMQQQRQMQQMQSQSANRRPTPNQMGPRTRQPNGMNNMPMPAHMAARQQQQNPMAQQQAMVQQAMAQQAMAQQRMGQRPQQPMQAQYMGGNQGGGMGPPMPAGGMPGGNVRTTSYENPQMPGYAWPSYASSPNYAAVSYPQQYSPSAWPYIGPFYPYPQVPLGWRKVALEWDDGWWFLDFSDRHAAH